MIAWIRRVFFGRGAAGSGEGSTSIPTVPIDCPSCSGLIEPDPTDGAFWTCLGLPTREDVVRVLGRKLPKPPPAHVVKISPCGWRDRAEGFGRDWW